jgi:two-component system, LytTR family, response regulator
MLTQILKAIVVDDEAPSRLALINYLNEYCPDVKIVGDCGTAKSAYQLITEQHPQLVFLDIEMPKGSGFDLLRMFNTIDFKVIFITAFSQYAVQAFRFAATDFLLKPIKVSELIEAVFKVRNELTPAARFDEIKVFLENIALPANSHKKLVIPNSQGFTVVNTNEIIMCEADGYCTHFFIENKTKLVSSRNLKFYEEILPATHFMRVHNSYIINISQVKSYSNQGEITLAGNLKCPLSIAHKKDFSITFRNKP